MSVPTAYETAVALAARGSLLLWLEVEGLPYAYGNVAKSSSWFSPRADSSEHFDGIRPWLVRDALPSIPPQELDHLEGRVSGGALEVRVEDVDGSLTALTAADRTDLWLTFANGVTATATGSTSVNGSTSSWDSSGVGYVGYETFAYSGKTSSTLTLSARGRYRSRGVAHTGGALIAETAANDDRRVLTGELVTPYPRKIEGRRVWLYAGHSASVTDARDCVCLWAGAIEEVAFGGPALNVLTLSCSQAFAELSQAIFSDLGTWGAAVGEDSDPPTIVIDSIALAGRNIEIGGGGIDPDVNQPAFEEGAAYQFSANGTTRALETTETQAAAKRRFFEVGGNVFRMGAAFETLTAISVYSARGVFVPPPGAQSRAYGGRQGDVIREVVPVCDDFGPFATLPHPLQVMLCVLLSDRGDGANDATYDVLPQGFGVGIDASRVDVAGIEDLIEQTPDLRVRFGVIEAVDDAGEWIRERLLKPFGFYLRASLGNLLSVGRLRLPTPDELSSAATLAHTDVREYGAWSSDVMSIVGTVQWSSGSRLGEDGTPGPMLTTSQVIQRDGRIVALEWPKARTVEVDATSIDFAPQSSRVLQARRTLLSMIAARFSKPSARLDVTLGFAHVLREVGEFVRLTSAFVPSRSSATRGVTSQVWEVVGKRIDLRTMSVVLTLRMTTIESSAVRYYAPAMLVASVSGADATITQAAFVGTGEDATDGFAVGDSVRAYGADDWFTRSDVATINAITGTVVTLSSAIASAGDVLVHADYSDWDALSSAAGAVVAFRANTAAVLVDEEANSDTAHEHS